MSIENLVRAIAGVFILATLILTQMVSPNWIWGTVFVGVNLLQSAFTGFCPLEIVLRKLKST